MKKSAFLSFLKVVKNNFKFPVFMKYYELEFKIFSNIKKIRKIFYNDCKSKDAYR